MNASSSIPHASSRILAVAWVLASILVLFALEDVWLGPFLKARFARFPALIPRPLSGLWFLAFTVATILAALLIAAAVLLIRDRDLPRLKRCGTVCFSVCVLLLCSFCFFVTATGSSPSSLLRYGKRHTVLLRWEPSPSRVDGYNLYRGLSATGPFERINKSVVHGLSFVDEHVNPNTKYFYVARSVDTEGNESANSEVAIVEVP